MSTTCLLCNPGNVTVTLDSDGAMSCTPCSGAHYDDDSDSTTACVRRVPDWRVRHAARSHPRWQLCARPACPGRPMSTPAPQHRAHDVLVASTTTLQSMRTDTCACMRQARTPVYSARRARLMRTAMPRLHAASQCPTVTYVRGMQ